MRLKPYLQLVRLPNLFTAAADPLAGCLLVGGSLASVRGWGPLAAAGVAIYASGMILNDAFDYHVDLKERPGRPLPSGRVSRRFASALGAALLVAGPALAALAGTTSLVVAVILAASVLAYDAGLKRTWIGPEAMGACRSLNLLLGMSQAGQLGGPAGWMAAAAFGLFVVGVTWISRDETEVGRSRGLVAGLTLQDLAMVGLLASALQVLPWPDRPASRPIVPVEGLLVLALTAWVVNLAGARALRDPRPSTLQAAVKTGVLSLVWLDVGLVASVRGVGPSLAVAALWVPAFLLGKWLYST